MPSQQEKWSKKITKCFGDFQGVHITDAAVKEKHESILKSFTRINITSRKCEVRGSQLFQKCSSPWGQEMALKSLTLSTWHSVCKMLDCIPIDVAEK